MRYLRFVFFPFTILYIIITEFRNLLYKVNIKRSFKFSIPIINVGNLSMGGTGKTPHIEYLIRLLKNNHHLATLSRGFGRKQRGFIIANEHSNAEQIGDEPLQFYKKYGKEITVAVEVDRVKGVMDLCYAKEKTDLVLLDDAYQHQAIKAGLNILLTDYNYPFYNDYVLPIGNLRELRKNKKRADVIIVTKCPGFKDINKGYLIKKIKPLSHQKVFFSRIKYNNQLTNFDDTEVSFNSMSKSAILVTGIANPIPLIMHLEKKIKILKHLKFLDHYQYKQKDIEEINNLLIKFEAFSPIVITTEKDAMRLLGTKIEPLIYKSRWFYQEIEVEIDNKNEFDKIILNYVQKNCRDY
ncbi:MAG TPA: tetraacyldisaccharide 4'-kinase [Crocinitomix sp.]|nr:tetraacyldisaccharide 4'-kinase [Crocinitomix sp.]